jgi:hypothetical protein
MTPNWRAVLLGAIAGLAAGLLIAIAVQAISGAETASGWSLLVVIGFAVSGYAGGRIAGFGHAAHGGIAALLAYLVIGGIAIASGSESGVVDLTLYGLVALTLGTAGGFLAARFPE